MIRANVTRGPRYPDPAGDQVSFNRAVVEMLKEAYKERLKLGARITAIEKRMEILEIKNVEGSRPPIRYSGKMGGIN